MDTLLDIGDCPEQREGFFRLLMEAAYDGVLITRDGVILAASKALIEASGYSAEELVGRPVTDFVAEEFRAAIRQRQLDGVTDRMDAVALTKDGHHLIVEIVTRKLELNGRVARVSAIRDVTEKRRIETQLQQAQKMQALGRLASGIAHDFNNVLYVVRSYSEGLSQELEDPHRSDALAILRAAETGAALTRHLLSFSRQQSPKLKSVDINVVVKESAEMLQRLTGPHIQMALDLSPELELVKADSFQLQQIMLNLVINACDAMPRGGRLDIHTRNIQVTESDKLGELPARPGSYVMLAVSDSGTGMPADVKAQIFEPFFTTKEAGRGTGLGLAIVRQIVEQYHGFIVVDSTVDIGSTFAIYFPVWTPPLAPKE